MFKKIFYIAAILALISLPALADENRGIDPADFSYIFHLYYDNGKLVTDRDFKFSYDIAASTYVAAPVTTQFPYRGDIFNFAGEVGSHFTFDPRHGDKGFIRGKLSVRAPYVADGQKAVFYDAQNQPILTISISESSYCNDNGICESDSGEDSLSCPKDCKRTLPAPPPGTNSDNSVLGSSSVIATVIYTVIGLALVIIAYFFFRRKRNTPPGPQSPISTPPTLPTPPVPPAPGNGV